MKRKVFFICLVLSIALTLVVPAPALAAKPIEFYASGVISEVTPGEVFPAGNSGRWIVQERQMIGNITGDINEDFTMTYKANVALEDQAGNFHGTIAVDSFIFNVRGKSQIIGPRIPGPPVETPIGLVSTDIYTLAITGGWTLNEGAHGNGDFIGSLVVLVATDTVLEGHIIGLFPLFPSGFTMTGQWKP